MLELNQLYNMDCMEGMKELPENCIDCCVTSPPYYGLRDYGVNGQIGLEETPEKYVEKMVEIFSEVKRVLKKEGTLWLNLGDSYWGGKGQSGHGDMEFQESRKLNKDSLNVAASHVGGRKKTRPTDKSHEIIKPKDLIGIPWMVGFALRADGWYLRSDIIWNKPNPMPESVKDRPTRAHEYIFLLSKSRKYFYDTEAIKTNMADTTIKRLMQDIHYQKGSNRVQEKTNGPMKAVGKIDKQLGHGRRHAGFNERYFDRKGYYHRGDKADKKFRNHSGNYDENGNIIGGGKANKRSVWTVATKPFKEAHFAVFPQDLIVDCIKAGSPEGGIVLDPFAGTNTTGIVAKKLNRNYISIELNADYIKIAENRTHKELGLFKNEVAK